ncbi:hypothetical protein NIES3585_03570 [Nodularia sp. NIES-3585]|nr:hypothetical protein NIES3585_03570 [Nodularia sp. NIES-3585]
MPYCISLGLLAFFSHLAKWLLNTSIDASYLRSKKSKIHRCILGTSDYVLNIFNAQYCPNRICSWDIEIKQTVLCLPLSAQTYIQ